MTKKLIALVGPTAVGKTDLSIELARRYQGEIVSLDSMQVYQGMDIGTAKIKEEEKHGIVHHMIDLFSPDHAFSVAEFQTLARQDIQDIFDRGHTPLLVGGTGLYVEAICYAYEFVEGAQDAALRAELHKKDPGWLHQELERIDPITAQKLHVHDTRRVVRAIEVCYLTKKKYSDYLAHQKKEPMYPLSLIGLHMPRPILYARIEQRVDLMFSQGLVEEVQNLLKSGIKRTCTSMQGIGYKEVVAYLEKEIDYETCIMLVKRNTRRFAKRQLSWFNRMKDIQWFDVSSYTGNHELVEVIDQYLAGK